MLFSTDYKERQGGGRGASREWEASMKLCLLQSTSVIGLKEMWTALLYGILGALWDFMNGLIPATILHFAFGRIHASVHMCIIFDCNYSERQQNATRSRCSVAKSFLLHHIFHMHACSLDKYVELHRDKYIHTFIQACIFTCKMSQLTHQISRCCLLSTLPWFGCTQAF